VRTDALLRTSLDDAPLKVGNRYVNASDIRNKRCEKEVLCYGLLRDGSLYSFQGKIFPSYLPG
jgi:hypothetical protein